VKREKPTLLLYHKGRKIAIFIILKKREFSEKGKLCCPIPLHKTENYQKALTFTAAYGKIILLGKAYVNLCLQYHSSAKTQRKPAEKSGKKVL
jgi:hypothetical protein